MPVLRCEALRLCETLQPGVQRDLGACVQILALPLLSCAHLGDVINLHGLIFLFCDTGMMLKLRPMLIS